MIRPVEIEGRYIGEGCYPYVVAEISGNHGGNLGNAKALIEQAKKAGADAVKLQTYTPEMLTIDCDAPDFIIDDPDSPWYGRKLYDLYDEAHTPWEWHEELFSWAKRLGITIFSSPFDNTAVDFLESLNCPAYKIASFENNYLGLIYKAALTGKPLIISTGASNLNMIRDAVNIAEKAGCQDIILLKCTSAYPSPESDINLLTIPHMQELFQHPVGLSDHTQGIGVAIASIAVGACMVEKHFCLEGHETVDSDFSLSLSEFRCMATEIRRGAKALGSVKYATSEKESQSRQFKRSIRVVDDIEIGDQLTRDNIKIIRPGGGLEPKFYGFALGSFASRSLKRGDPLTINDIGG